MEAEEGFMTCLFMVDLESGEAKRMYRDGEVWAVSDTAYNRNSRRGNARRILQGTRKWLTRQNTTLIKPTVGGSENAWGGNSNDNFDNMDDLLGGEQPVNGLRSSSPAPSTAALISGEIGGSDPDNPTSIHPDTEISGKVKRLVWDGRPRRQDRGRVG